VAKIGKVYNRKLLQDLVLTLYTKNDQTMYQQESKSYGLERDKSWFIYVVRISPDCFVNSEVL
jgi:hypothetical protein